MPLAVDCPECGAPFTVGDEFRGKRIRCKSCGGTIPVGNVPEPSRPRKRRERSSGGMGGNTILLIGLLVGGLMLALVFVGIVVVVIVVRKPNAPGSVSPILAADVVGWPDAPEIRGYAPDNTVILHISGCDKASYDAISQWLSKLSDTPGVSTFASTMVNDRMVARMAPVRDPAAFATRVEFGRVILVNGRTVTIVANRNVTPPKK
jgi:predicted Zn finger-like uncharacterized protein